MEIGSGTEATFVSQDPARTSYFALWDPQETGGLLSSASKHDAIDVQLVLPDGGGKPGRRWVSSERLSIPEALQELVSLPAAAKVSDSVRAAAIALRWGLDLIGRGRLLPWISPRGMDTWRVDPLDSEDQEFLAKLVADLPPYLHCTPAPDGDGGAVRVAEPAFMLRNLLDAVGDAMVRTPAAAALTSSPLFSATTSFPAPQLRPWVADTCAPHCSGASLTLLVLPPPLSASDDVENEGGPPWVVRFRLRSGFDPSLVIDASELWESTSEILEHFGDRAEADLLTGLKRASQIAPTLAAALEAATPSELELSTAQVVALMDDLDKLEEGGIQVSWPANILVNPFERILVAKSAAAPAGGLMSLTDYNTLIDVNWEFLLEGTALSFDEMKTLSGAKRGLVPIRGRWIRLDAAARRKLLAPVPDLTTQDALSAALGMGISVPAAPGVAGGSAADGVPEEDVETVEVRVEGALADLADRLVVVAGEREEAEPDGFTATLRPYQRRGLAWMTDLCDAGLGGCLADDMGLGKTIQILALHSLRSGPTLVVCPTTLLANWEREAATFAPGARVHRFHGPSRALPDLQPMDIVLTTYGVVRSDAEKLADLPWNLIVADEAQAMKNPNSRTARSMRLIEQGNRIALTGTPVENRLTELWSILDWCVPGVLGPMQWFRREVALPIERDNDRSIAERLTQRINPFLLRRRKSDPAIAPELPPKTERDVIVPLTAEQVTLYAATTEEAMADVQNNEGLVRHGLVLKMLTALKQITNHPAHYLGETSPLHDRSGKLAALEGLVDNALASNESVLIFSQFVAMGSLLEQHLADRGISAGFLHGSLTVSKRQELVDRFQARELPVLLLSLKAGGTGLNLTAATQVIHYDRWWNPAVEDQATDRAYRIGQDLPVTVHRLITEGTVEDRIALILQQKRALADQVVSGGESWIGNMDDDELIDLVGLDPEVRDLPGAA